MKSKVYTLLTLSSLVILSLFSPQAALSAEIKPLPAIAPIPADNPMTQGKIELGKMLFFEPRLSGSNWISCATCHNPVFAFTDRIALALGHNMSEGPRNTPTILNAAFLKVQFWDGRAKTLEEQALGPIQAEIEMNEKLEAAVRKLKQIPEYVRRFKEVFKGDEPINAANIAKAIAAFERVMITPNSPLDRYLSGDKQALNESAQKGMVLFKEKGCIDCHDGPALSDSNFHRIKVPGSTDLGRYLVTKKDSDKHAFRTPTLRNIELTAPYMNNGSVPGLKLAVKIMGREALGEELTKEEVEQIVSFLKSLTGEAPKFEYPVLP